MARIKKRIDFVGTCDECDRTLTSSNRKTVEEWAKRHRIVHPFNKGVLTHIRRRHNRTTTKRVPKDV